MTTTAAGSARRMAVSNRSRRRVLAAHAHHACSFRERFFGLMGRRDLPEGSGLLFAPCRGVHTHFMRFPIDLVFVAIAPGGGRVLHVREAMRPFRADWTSSDLVIELPAGTVARTGTTVGDLLDLPSLSTSGGA